MQNENTVIVKIFRLTLKRIPLTITGLNLQARRQSAPAHQ